MILNSNPNYKDANFIFSQDIVSSKRINFRPNPYMQNYLNYNANNNNFINQASFFNNSVNQYMNPYNRQINTISNYNNIKNILNPIYNNNNTQFNSQNYLNHKENVELNCICDNKNYISKNDLMQCILCNKYQHKECINQAKEIIPYICFNCQFMNNHFYLRHIKTILPAKEFLYKKKWEDDPSFLSEGTKTFEFPLDLIELYEKYNININNENNSYYLAILCLTNNGKPFHLGFPDNINISINDKKFYNIDSKGFKRPLLLSIENNKYYIPKRRHLITSEKYEIPNAADFFPNINNNIHRITISFSNNLENYRGSEFEFVDVRHYLIYIGVFQEIRIPQLSLLRECKNLEEYFKIFKVFYEEKVKKIKWSKISNFVSLDNEQLNMNMISEISNQRIICPVRGLFCQHTDIMDFGECCGYITSNNQVYKCFKCNKPMNIMYIDDMSEKIFNKYKNENFSQIYFSTNFKFIRGEKIEENNGKGKDIIKQIENDPSDESLSESFFKYYENKVNIEEFNKYDEIDNSKGNVNEIIELNSDTESMLIEPNNMPSDYLPLENNNMNQELEKRNEPSGMIAENMRNTNNNINDNSNIQGNNIVVINNLEKSNVEIQPLVNIYNKENSNEENKNKIDEEVITLMEEEEDEEKEDNTNSIFSNIGKIPNKENGKENLINNNTSSQQNQTSESNNISDSSSIVRKNEENISNHFQDINLHKSVQNILKINPLKENINIFDGKTNEFLEKKRDKEVNKINKKKEIEKERENDIRSPRKRIFRRIEDGSSVKPKNKNKKSMKEREYILEIEKEKENNNKNNIKSNNIKEIQNNFTTTTEDIIKNKQDNYLRASLYNGILNSNEKNGLNPKNKSTNNNNEIKNKRNKRRNSDKTSSSNSFNTQSNNFVISEYDKKEINKNKRKKKKKSKLNKGKEKNHNTEKSNKNNELNSDTSKNNISEINKIIQANENIEINDKNKKVENLEDDYETIMIDSKDLIEIKPYNKHKDKERINMEEEEFLNDFDIFENELLDKNQMEFLNYDYYNIQRKLREFCSLRYHDDEIFNGNKIFFNDFK